MKTIQFDETKYKLVPLEPTDEMLKALTITASLEASWASAYKACIKAAPAAEEAPGQDDKVAVMQRVVDKQTGFARDTQEAPFEEWWKKHGQFCRASGGDYEKTFAWNAWCEAASKQPATHGEPVAWMNAKRDMSYLHGPYNKDDIPLYTSPQPTSELVQAARMALRVLTGFADIIEDSEGVSGYHKNGNLAEWGEFSEPDDADEAIIALQSALPKE